MKDVGRDVPEVTRRRLFQELKGLIGPAFEPALKAYGRSFAELIAQDEDFCVEVRDRFERGRTYGGFSALSALLSGKTPEEQETFFETGWIRLILPPSGPPGDHWDRAPWAGDHEAYREDLYSGLAFAFTDLGPSTRSRRGRCWMPPKRPARTGNLTGSTPSTSSPSTPECAPVSSSPSSGKTWTWRPGS